MQANSTKRKPSFDSNNVGVDPALEEDARRAEDLVSEARYKLVEAWPTIQRVRAHFAAGKRGSRAVVFRGCKGWHAYCRERLHVTPEVIHMMEKRMNLKEAAKEIERERRREARWQRQAQHNDHGSGPALLSLPERSTVGDEPDIEDVLGDIPDLIPSEPEPDGIDLDTILPIVAAASDVLDKVIASNLISGDLLASTRTAARRTRKLADDIRAELKISDDDAKVTNIRDYQ